MSLVEKKVRDLAEILSKTNDITVEISEDGNYTMSGDSKNLGEKKSNEIAKAIKELIIAIIQETNFFIAPGQVVTNVVGQATGIPNSSPIKVTVKTPS